MKTGQQNILILGGTGEARMLANALVTRGERVITALAGRTSEPLLPDGEVRIGGFGGVEGLVRYLDEARIDRLVLATHPYAAQISRNAVMAAEARNIPLLRLVRPGWTAPAGGRWLEVASSDDAARALPHNARVLLTTGHAGLSRFLARQDCMMMLRVIEAPAEPLPANVRLIVSRPPYSLEGEMTLMRKEAITHLITKNSGGEQTVAKIAAAQALGITVVMIARPRHLPAHEVNGLEEALLALQRP